MHILVIGGTGHIGSYLVPQLVEAGHDLTVITRGQRQPYHPHPAWSQVRTVQIDRTAAEADGSFGFAIRDLNPDAVMDMLCFTLESARQLVEALRGRVQLFAHCGTIWVRGWGVEVPAREDHPRNPLTQYGVRKNQIEAYLLGEARRTGFPAVALHPGHIVGPGWDPVGPTGCHDNQAIGRCIRGEEVVLPNLGLETLHHVHAADVAQAFANTLVHWRAAIGEGFFIVSPNALTLRGFAEGLAGRFGREANLRFAPIDAWIETVPPEWREEAMAHLTHCSNCAIAKAQAQIGFQPRYTSLDAVEESVRWLVDHGKIQR